MTSVQFYPAEWKYYTYSLIRQIVSLKFSVVGILNINRLMAEVRSSSSIVVHHSNRSFFRSHFQKCLQPIHSSFQCCFVYRREQSIKAPFISNSTLTRKGSCENTVLICSALKCICVCVFMGIFDLICGFS